MPKLETTIDNLELKTNKVIGTPSADWTDAQYPSAKTLFDVYNIVHPVGSILITSTNTNPSETYGGEWELVDKAFKGKFSYINPSDWQSDISTMHETANILLTDHMITLRIYVMMKSTVNLKKADSTDPDVTLGKLDIAKYGISSLSSATYRHPAVSDIGNCTIVYTLTTDGTITINDVFDINDTHILAEGSDVILNILLPVGYDRMADDYCDKFYWKRKA